VADNTVVSIKRIAGSINQESVSSAVRKAASLALEGENILRGKKVVIKPNIFCPMPAPTTTDPRVITALVSYALECGASEAIVAEGRSISTAKYRKTNNTTRACAEVLGITKAVESAGGRMVFFEEDEFVEVPVPGGRVLKTVRVPRTVLEAEVFINNPVLKIHSLTLVTLGIKNLHGAISDEDKLFGHSYPELPAKLTDFLRVRKPDLTVIDGITGLEGDHADEGTPVEMGIIIAGRDVVAVDAVASAVIGFEPSEIDTTALAHEFGLGQGSLSAIQVAGDSIESVRRPFARPDVVLDAAMFPGLEIIAGDYCRSCQYYIRRGLDKLADAGAFSPDKKVTIILGKEPQVPDRLPGKVFMLGDCCLSSDSIRRLRDHLLLDGRLQMVYACPPMQFRIRALEMMGD